MGRLAWAIGVLLLSGSSPTDAGSLALSPTRLELSSGHAVDAVTVTNQSGEATVVQLEAMAWNKAQGQDIYTPTTDLIAAPPIFTVPPGGTQIVRIGLRRAPDPQRELAYRVYFQEIPPPPKVGFQGLQIALRLGVPVYVAPASGTLPKDGR